MPSRSFLPSASRQSGFSLVELLVSVVIMAEILVGVAILFDSSNRLARAQTHVAELQQSMRVGQSEVVRFAKAAGIGGLPITRLNLPAAAVAEPQSPYGAFPRAGYAVSVLNDHSGTIGPDTVVPGSDVLVLRGVFTTPLFYFDPPIDISGWLPIEDREVIIPDRVRVVGQDWEDFPQDIAALGERLTEAKNATPAQSVALILRDTLNPNAYAVLQFDHDDTQLTDLTPAAALCAGLDPAPPAGADPANCIRFKLRLDPNTEPGTSYGKLTAGTTLITDQPPDAPEAMAIVLPAGSDDPPSTTAFHVELPTEVGSIGLLEELRFFVRAEYEVPGDTTTRLTPVLSRASFLPGTNTRIDRVDIADNVIDLQIAIGVDTDPPGAAGFGEITENDDPMMWVADEVLFNEEGDVENDGKYKAPPGAATRWYDPDRLQYHFLRINTLVQSRFPDLQHRAPLLSTIEDYNRGVPFTIGGVNYSFNDEVQYHRRWLQTVVELRNLL